MALVTIQRSPSNSNSISSSSDSGGIREEENQRTCKSLNECYFAGKGTALMLGSNERLQRLTHYSADGRRFSQISNELSASQTSIGSVGSDIQQHLQSMFYLLRPEETLKMAVKLESLRAGRTRYLVVVSRPASKKTLQSQQQQSGRLCASPNRNSNNQAPSSTDLMTATENIASPHLTNIDESSQSNQGMKADDDDDNNSSILTNFQSISEVLHSSANMTTAVTASCDNDSTCNLAINQHFCSSSATTTNIIDDQQCDNESTIGSSCSSKSSSNEIEESCLLGIDCNEKTTVGLVLKVLADTAIRLDGDGGFSVSVCGRQHIFKPVSVQAMWSALQTLYKISSKAHEHNFFAGGPSHDWVQYYENRIESDRSCLNEWHTMDSIESRRPPSPDTIRTKPTERGDTERVIRAALKEIMMSVDLDEVTSKYIRGRLEEHLDMDLNEFKSFIDEEMLVILGQMDAPTEIFDHVYLGSEWNASNLEELQRNGVGHILNVTREIDNFFPGMFDYFNVRVYDDEKTDLLKHWDNTFRYISRAKLEGSKVLVHCKMGISRSASVVIAYAMKQYNWEFDQAIQHVKDKRNCIKPNKNFLTQLETYQGILDAMKNKEKLQRSKSETNLKSENSKDGKSLPGSEPTPLIQAMQHNKNLTYPSSKKEASYLKRIHQRPSSSPDISKTTNETLSNVKPISISLETLVTATDAHTDQSTTVASETTNLRWPCNNGHYSVSQNQIIYLENESANTSIVDNSTVPLVVRSIISELEQHHEKMKKKDEENQERELTAKKEPDMVDNDNNNNKQQVYTCSAEIIHQEDSFDSSVKVTLKTASSPAAIQRSPSIKKENDSFSKQVDRVFDREEKRQITRLEPNIKETAPPHFMSRQSSWSSVDSACIVGDLPSRNSSWGSGDNRPSRNSSWGSYDTKTTAVPTTLNEDVVMGQSGIFPYEKEEIPWHPGTVKRTKQKIEEKQITPSIMRSSSGPSPSPHHHHHQIDAKNNNSNNNKILCDIKKSLLIDNLTNRTNMQHQKGSSASPHKFAKLRQSSSVSSAAISSSKQHMRCKSEEYLTAQRALLTAAHYSRNSIKNSHQPLSVSAPETFCLSFNEKPAIQRQKSECEVAELEVKLRRTDDDNKKANKKENQTVGKVKNLKMNFEAKANNNHANLMSSSATTTTATKNRENRKNCQSLPSSPIAIHIDVSSTTGFPSSDLGFSEDKSVRERVECFEYGRINSIFNSTNLKQRPKSLYESKFQLKSFGQHQRHQQPYQISHKTIFTKNNNDKRPPFQSTLQPTVKNALMTSNQNNLVSTKPSMMTTVHCRKQEGKSHPLTKLNLTNKQRINTSPTTAYNTM